MPGWIAAMSVSAPEARSMDFSSVHCVSVPGGQKALATRLRHSKAEGFAGLCHSAKHEEELRPLTSFRVAMSNTAR
jgi:hypothetical protein